MVSSRRDDDSGRRHRPLERGQGIFGLGFGGSPENRSGSPVRSSSLAMEVSMGTLKLICSNPCQSRD